MTAAQQQQMGGGPPGQPAGMFPEEMIGAIKIKDGLFIGDELASTDLEFVVANKVTHIINCAGKQVPNHWEPIGVAYLTFFWLDQDNQMLLDGRDEASNAIFDFIEEALNATESVLVHSVRGQSRATCALAAYIMRKYKWSLLKSLEFLNSRRPDLEIRATFIHQLSAYEARLANSLKLPISSKWDELSNKRPTYTCEELVLRNTFMNSQMGPIANLEPQEKDKDRKRAIKWLDEDAPGEDKEKEIEKKKLVTNKSDEDLIYKEGQALVKISTHRDETKKSSLKSKIKQYELDPNKNTGIVNFVDIAPNPLKLPDYAIAIEHVGKGGDTSVQSSVHGEKSLQEGSVQQKKQEEQKPTKNNQRPDQKAKRTQQQAAPPSNDLFYNKQQSSDIQLLSANEDDMIDEVNVEVKPSKGHRARGADSDFESDVPNKGRPQQRPANKSSAERSQKTTNKFLGERTQIPKKSRFVDESGTEMSDDEKGKIEPRDRKRPRGGVKQINAHGNVTNIINNNNINNFIINDPSKVPNFHQVGQPERVSTAAPINESNPDFNNARDQPKSGSAGGQRPRKQAQQFRSNSLTNRKDGSQDGSQQYIQNYGSNGDRFNRTQPTSQGALNSSGRVASQKRKMQSSAGFNNNVVSIVKKELQKRHESPRSRRQLINNLAGPQSYSRGKPGSNQMVGGPGQGGQVAFGPNSQNDLTFFDSKMFTGTKGARSVGARSGGVIATGPKFAMADQNQAPQFFNRTGPIKIPHGQKFTNKQMNQTTHHQSQQVEDMFHADEPKQKQKLNNTQKISNSEGGLMGKSGRVQGQAPGSRRELQQSSKGMTGGTLQNRPGTAPQTVNGLLTSNSTKGNRPMSPFTKVYQNQLVQQRGQKRTGQKRLVGSSHGPPQSQQYSGGLRAHSPGQNTYSSQTRQQRSGSNNNQGAGVFGANTNNLMFGNYNPQQQHHMNNQKAGPQFYQQARGNSPFDRTK